MGLHRSDVNKMIFHNNFVFLFVKCSFFYTKSSCILIFLMLSEFKMKLLLFFFFLFFLVNRKVFLYIFQAFGFFINFYLCLWEMVRGCGESWDCRSMLHFGFSPPFTNRSQWPEASFCVIRLQM